MHAPFEADYEKEKQHGGFDNFRRADFEVDDLEPQSFSDDCALVNSQNFELHEVVFSPNADGKATSVKRSLSEENANDTENHPTGKRMKLPKSLFKVLQIDHHPKGQAEHFRKHFEIAVKPRVEATKEIFYPLSVSRFLDISSLPSFSEDSISQLPSLIIPDLKHYLFNGEGTEKQVSKSKLRKGGPLIWFICMSGLRCMDVYRAFRKIEDLKCAKLFAKHLKLEQQIDFLKNNHVHVAIGTPGRLAQLLPHMSTSNLHAIILDSTYVDRTQRSLLTKNDSRDAFFQLYFDHLYDLCKGKDIPLESKIDNLPEEWSKKKKKKEFRKQARIREMVMSRADTKLCLF